MTGCCRQHACARGYPTLSFRANEDAKAAIHYLLSPYLAFLFIYNINVTLADTSEVVYMASTVVQVRMDESLRLDAANIAEQLGLDLPTAIRIFLKKMVAERAIPFSLSLPRETPSAMDGLVAMQELGRQAEQNGTSNMSLDEINAEIAEVRSSRAARYGN